MSWATNIVRLPLETGAHDDLAKQIGDFPPEFLLFVDHVHYLTLEDGERSRDFMLHRRDGELRLDTGEGTARWRRFDTTHRLSAEARADWPLHDDSDDALVQWAAPLDRLDRPGHFWAFFPTTTASLVAGILNAPWKTNEDRQNLLPGPYNDELIEAAAAMIAERASEARDERRPCSPPGCVAAPARGGRHRTGRPSSQAPVLQSSRTRNRSRSGRAPPRCRGSLVSSERVDGRSPDGHGAIRALGVLPGPTIELASPQGTHAQPARHHRPAVSSALAGRLPFRAQGHNRRMVEGARRGPGTGRCGSSLHGSHPDGRGDTARGQVERRAWRYRPDGKR